MLLNLVLELLNMYCLNWRLQLVDCQSLLRYLYTCTNNLLVLPYLEGSNTPHGREARKFTGYKIGK